MRLLQPGFADEVDDETMLGLDIESCVFQSWVPRCGEADDAWGYHIEEAVSPRSAVRSGSRYDTQT